MVTLPQQHLTPAENLSPTKLYFKAHQLALINLLPALLKNWHILFITFFMALGGNFYLMENYADDTFSPFNPLITGPPLIGWLQNTIIFFTLSLKLHQLTLNDDSLSLWRFVQTKALIFMYYMAKTSLYILLWSLLFFIPGVVKTSRYFFVAFVVFFESDPTNNGKRGNPFLRSHELSKNLMLFLIPTTITMSCLNALVTSGPETNHSLPKLALLQVGGFALWCYGTSLYYYIYHLKSSSMTQSKNRH